MNGHMEICVYDIFFGEIQFILGFHHHFLMWRDNVSVSNGMWPNMDAVLVPLEGLV